LAAALGNGSDHYRGAFGQFKRQQKQQIIEKTVTKAE
jgi:hypothetical protein